MILVATVALIFFVCIFWRSVKPENEYQKYVTARLIATFLVVCLWLFASARQLTRLQNPSELGSVVACLAVLIPTYYMTHPVRGMADTQGPVPCNGGKWMRTEREMTSDRAKQIAAAAFALGTLLVSAQPSHPKIIEVALAPMLWGLLFCVFVAIPAYLNRGEDEHPLTIAMERTTLSLSGSFICLAVAMAIATLPSLP